MNILGKTSYILVKINKKVKEVYNYRHKRAPELSHLRQKFKVGTRDTPFFLLRKLVLKIYLLNKKMLASHFLCLFLLPMILFPMVFTLYGLLLFLPSSVLVYSLWSFRPMNLLSMALHSIVFQ